MEQRAREKGIKKQDPRYHNRYPFTKKLICGECGTALKRHINSTGSLRYPVWICKQHLENIDGCSMKAINESDLEYAFTTMMNKLIFARKEILHNLLESIQRETQKRNTHQIEDIDRELEKNAKRVQTLTTIMSKGYIEPALFTRESNELAAESKALTDEKERLTKAVTGKIQKMDDLSNLVKYIDKAQLTDSFDGTLVTQFLDHATIHSRTEITFYLKCGLNLKEKM